MGIGTDRLRADTYTPTLVNPTNISASAVNAPFNFIVIGSQVWVNGRISLTPTAGAVITAISLDVPVFSSLLLGPSVLDTLSGVASRQPNAGGNTLAAPLITGGVSVTTGKALAVLIFTNDANVVQQNWSLVFGYPIF